MPKLGFTVEPRGASGCVVVLHEVWGLTRHTKDVCKRLGKLGFAAVAPDLFKRHETALTPANLEEAMSVVWDLTLEERWNRPKLDMTLAKKRPRREVTEAVNILYDRRFREGILADVSEVVDEAVAKFGGVSMLGFSFGGGVAFRVAARTGRLRSIVSFYGDPPDKDDLTRIAAPMLAIYAGEDHFMNRRVPEFADAAARAGKDLTLETIPGANHDFFDNTKRSYDERASRRAWGLTSKFLLKTLGSKKL